MCVEVGDAVDAGGVSGSKDVVTVRPYVPVVILRCVPLYLVIA
jgi:hypothetical protein